MKNIYIVHLVTFLIWIVIMKINIDNNLDCTSDTRCYQPNNPRA